jgi:hypothetical protein
MLLQMKYLYRDAPIVNMRPVALRDQSAAPGEGSKLSCFEYEFEVPWQDVDAQNIQRKSMVLIPFRSGLQIVMGHGSTHELVDTVMKNSETSPQDFRVIYGDEAAGSDYDFLNLVLNATPGQVSLLDSKKAVVRKSTLVLYKALVVPGESGIFEVQANEFRGFQYGDPDKHPKKVTVVLYSAQGGAELNFRQKDSKPLTISQRDINRAIQTLRYTSPGYTVEK